MQKNYLVAIISLVLIVGIVLFVMDNQLSFPEEDIAGEAIAKKTVEKTSKAKIATKSTKATTKEFCGDKTCVDGEHVSCYMKKGECECETCKVTPFSKEFQDSLKGKESLKILSERNIPAPTINPDAYIVNCQSDTRYTTGAPIIDAFMMEFLTNIDEETLEDFSNFVEIAFCNATNGEIVINITPEKYNWTNTSYPKNFTDYQPFMDDKWEYLWDEEEYADVITLTYDDLLDDEDMPRFYYYWLNYQESTQVEDFSFYQGFVSYAEEIGYTPQKDDILIILSGVSGLINSGLATGADYSDGTRISVNYIAETHVYLHSYSEDGSYITRSSNLETEGYYPLTDTIIHELGHYLNAFHACDEDDGGSDCDICPWKDDVMSYCSVATTTEYSGYTGCTMDYFRENIIPYIPQQDDFDGSDYPCDYK